MSLDGKTNVRMSKDLLAFLGTLGQNENAIIRACLLLGLETAGYDVTQYVEDVRTTLGQPLPATLYHRMRAIYERTLLAEGEVTAESPAAVQPAEVAPPEEPDDPFGVGFEV